MRRKFWLSLNASYWFIPTLLTLTALVLSFATIYIDRNGGAQWLTDLGWVQVTRPDGARSLLTVISSSMIGVASTVFRSEEHTSELQSLMRILYAVFCLKKKNTKIASQLSQTCE